MGIYDEFGSKILYMGSKGNLTLEEIADLIAAGDDECINHFLRTVQSTIAATHTRLHVQAVKLLVVNFDIIRGYIKPVDYPRKHEIEQAFANLKNYSKYELQSKLH